METNSFQVVITNQLKPDQDKNLITQKLATLFKVDEQKAAQFLIKPRTIIKDNLDEATANKYLAAIQQTGAPCEIVNKKETVDLPQIVEPPRVEQQATQPRSTSQTASRPSQEPPLSLIAREQKIKKETQEKLSALHDTSEETLCPHCGTIRGSVDATCLHCGYDPLEIARQKKSHLMKLVTPVLVVAVIAAIALLAGLPFFQKYMALKKVEQDFKLVYETQDQVAAFIEQTNFFPNQNMDANLPDQINNDSIKSIIISDNATITVTMNAEAIGNSQDQTIIFTPKTHQGKIVWNCMQGTLDNKFRPDSCKN